MLLHYYGAHTFYLPGAHSMLKPALMVTTNIDEIKCTINDTVTNNIENIYEDSNRKKTLIIYNIEEQKLIKK